MSQSQENSAVIIAYLNQLRKAIVDFKATLEQRLDAYFSAQHRGEDPYLRVPREKGGVEPAISQSELARIQYALHIKFPNVDKKRIPESDFLPEHVEGVKSMLKELLEIVSDLKIRPAIPGYINEWLGEDAISPRLKHIDI